MSRAMVGLLAAVCTVASIVAGEVHGLLAGVVFAIAAITACLGACHKPASIEKTCLVTDKSRYRSYTGASTCV
jgi:hypothetical protein